MISHQKLREVTSVLWRECVNLTVVYQNQVGKMRSETKSLKGSRRMISLPSAAEKDLTVSPSRTHDYQIGIEWHWINTPAKGRMLTHSTLPRFTLMREVSRSSEKT